MNLNIKFILIFIIGSLLSFNFVAAESNSTEFDIMAKKYALKFKVNVMTAAELKKAQLTKEVIVLDSREPDEYKVSHIKGAIGVGYKKFNLKKTIEALDKNKKVVVYCSVGYRSGKIAEKLKNKGYKAYNLKRGLFGWVNNGYTVVNSKGQTGKIHGYNKSWSKWLSRGEIVYSE